VPAIIAAFLNPQVSLAIIGLEIRPRSSRTRRKGLAERILAS
jgi:hypothetical protein